MCFMHVVYSLTYYWGEKIWMWRCSCTKFQWITSWWGKCSFKVKGYHDSKTIATYKFTSLHNIINNCMRYSILFYSWHPFNLNHMRKCELLSKSRLFVIYSNFSFDVASMSNFRLICCGFGARTNRSLPCTSFWKNAS
jgi:hypothetical protein